MGWRCAWRCCTCWLEGTVSRLLIKHGRVVDPTQRLDEGLWVLVVDGKVARLAERIDDRDAEVLDATGLVVAPGFVDVHTHLREPGFEYKETVATARPRMNSVTAALSLTEFIRGRA